VTGVRRHHSAAVGAMADTSEHGEFVPAPEVPELGPAEDKPLDPKLVQRLARHSVGDAPASPASRRRSMDAFRPQGSHGSSGGMPHGFMPTDNLLASTRVGERPCRACSSNYGRLGYRGSRRFARQRGDASDNLRSAKKTLGSPTIIGSQLPQCLVWVVSFNGTASSGTRKGRNGREPAEARAQLFFLVELTGMQRV
jgi:hypothetical protein